MRTRAGDSRTSSVRALKARPQTATTRPPPPPEVMEHAPAEDLLLSFVGRVDRLHHAGGEPDAT